ncbi:hemolysin [Ammoniphilus oxalaticus]|uniref:Hemolysin n=2 Tax=Ammoniphilus oxalaticus TaxID=66863 RepID=A0A419SME6_9BACL|nr:hemolysin [Ammoniphilus oxalaticus]
MILALLIIINAFFAASEIALISLNDNKVKVMAESGDKNAMALYKLLNEPSRFLATIQIGLTFAGFFASAFAAERFSGRLAQFLHRHGAPIPEHWLAALSLIIITLILSYFTLVIGELVPKRLAMQKPEPIAKVVVRPLTLLSSLTSPFVKLLTVSTNMLVRLFGVDPNANDDHVTEEEIRMMVDVGEERGAIQDTEKMMINNIFDFDNITVEEIMTHRTNMVAFPLDSTLKEVVPIILAEKYTRYPVYDGHIDNIVGIIHAKDLLRYIGQQDAENIQLNAILRKPYFVPASRVADELMEDLKCRKVHMAIVIDEYGGTAGLVTFEDLVEEIVGNIFDEHDDEEFEVVEIGTDTYLMNGMLNLHDVEKMIEVDFPTDNYDTLSGFLIGQIGDLPNGQQQPSQVIEFQDHLFSIEEANDKRITKVKVAKKPLIPLDVDAKPEAEENPHL